MKYIEISDDNYTLLIANQGTYKTLEEFIMALLRFWQATEYEAHGQAIETLDQAQEKRVIERTKNIKANNDGHLWQFVASRFPEFPYDYFEYFELHSPADKHPPIDGIAFPGLVKGTILRVDLIDFQLTSPYASGNKKQVKNCIDNHSISFRIINPKTLNLNFHE